MHDVWAIGTNVYFKVYGIVIFLFMCTTMNLSFTWEISILGMSIVGLLMALLFFFFYPSGRIPDGPGTVNFWQASGFPWWGRYLDP